MATALIEEEGLRPGTPVRPCDVDVRASAVRPPLPVLTSLRFLAAAEVVVTHYWIGKVSKSDVLWGVTTAGYQAVTFFFVLSGFILTYVYAGSDERNLLNIKPVEFWRARMARLVPVYYLGLALSLPFLLYAVFISRIISIPRMIEGLFLTPLFLQAWWPPAERVWDSPAWSLSVEFSFYLLFPYMGRAVSYFSRGWFIAVAFGLVVAFSILQQVTISILASSPRLAGWGDLQDFPLFHLPYFIFGMALGRIYLFAPPFGQRMRAVAFLLGSAALALMFGLRAFVPIWIVSASTLVLPYSLVIMGGTSIHRVLRPLASPSAVFLGEASYAMYILHIPLLFWWSWFSHKVIGLGVTDARSFLVYFFLVATISGLSFVYLERPLRRRILGRREHRAA